MTLHVVQRGNNRSQTFFATEDYREYLRLLRIASARYETRIHAYALMTNHVHLLLTPLLPSGVSGLLQYVGARYVARLNARLERTGTLWEGRFRSSPVASDNYCLACYRYIELNPVRADIVKDPAEYPWSSYRFNAQGVPSEFLSPHPTFLALATHANERRRCYRELVGEALPEQTLSEIRRAVRTGAPTGGKRFKEKIEAAVNRRVGNGRGRPRNESRGTNAGGKSTALADEGAEPLADRNPSPPKGL
jgi:putative transposase